MKLIFDQEFPLSRVYPPPYLNLAPAVWLGMVTCLSLKHYKLHAKFRRSGAGTRLRDEARQSKDETARFNACFEVDIDSKLIQEQHNISLADIPGDAQCLSLRVSNGGNFVCKPRLPKSIRDRVL